MVTFERKCYLFYYFLKLNVTILSACSKLFVGFNKTAFYTSQKHFQDKDSFWNQWLFFHRFRTLSVNNWAICLNFSSEVVKTEFYTCRGSFRGKNYCFEHFIFFYQFHSLSENSPLFSQKNFVGFVETAF